MMRGLTTEDLVRALELFGAKYQALDVFADDLDEGARKDVERGAVKVGNGSYRFRVFETHGVVRLERVPSVDLGSAATGALAGTTLGAAVSAAMGQKEDGLLGGALLGLLIGGALGAGAGSGTPPTKVFALQFDVVSGQWLAYDGSMLRWLKQQLLPISA